MFRVAQDVASDQWLARISHVRALHCIWMAFHSFDTSQEVLLWKKFAAISNALSTAADRQSTTAITSWHGENPLIREANEWAATSLLNQLVVDALMESVAKFGKEIQIPQT